MKSLIVTNLLTWNLCLQPGHYGGLPERGIDLVEEDMSLVMLLFCVFESVKEEKKKKKVEKRKRKRRRGIEKEDEE